MRKKKANPGFVAAVGLRTRTRLAFLLKVESAAIVPRDGTVASQDCFSEKQRPAALSYPRKKGRGMVTTAFLNGSKRGRLMPGDTAEITHASAWPGNGQLVDAANAANVPVQ